jgi:auxin efflux carrier family protein
LKSLHWDKRPGDNYETVGARGILYLLIFQQLGQLVRWSWGYHVLLAPPESYELREENEAIEEGRYRDDPNEQLIPGLDGGGEGEEHYDYSGQGSDNGASSTSFESGGRTPITNAPYVSSGADSDEEQFGPGKAPSLVATPANGNTFPNDRSNGNLTSFPTIKSPSQQEEQDIPAGIKGFIPMVRLKTRRGASVVSHRISATSRELFERLPSPFQKFLLATGKALARFFRGVLEFMNPPLWAMLIAIVVASVPKLQDLFFTEGFIANSVTRAVGQSGGVAVPLILVVLGANLARNTTPREAVAENSEENEIGRKLMVASLISRMLLPTIIMAPLLALAAKYVPVSIVDDPIFVIVCFLLTGAPSALQLAQICQINGVYENVMSKLLFQSYVIWYVLLPSFAPFSFPGTLFLKSLSLTKLRILPSTLILVMCALEVVEWAKGMN